MPLTDLEQKRLANIAKNQQILQQLALDAGQGLLQPARPKRQPTKSTTSEKKKPPAKKIKTEPVRRSSRLQQVDPIDYTKENVIQAIAESSWEEKKTLREGPVELSDDVKPLLLSLQSAAASDFIKQEKEEPLDMEDEQMAAELSALNLTESDDPVKLVMDRIQSALWHPSPSTWILSVGDKMGRLGFWHVAANQSKVKEEEEVKKEDAAIKSSAFDMEEAEPKVYTFHPHDGGIPCMRYDPHDATKLMTCSYDGSIRMMDVAHEKFDQLYVCPDRDMICAIDAKDHSLFFTKHSGDLIHMDMRSKSTEAYVVSEKKVCSVHVNPQHPHYISTSGLDRTWNIWDLRKMEQPLQSFTHGYSCTSAYWNARGDQLTSISYDSTIKVFDFDQSIQGEVQPKFSFHQDNQTGRWVTNFRAYFHTSPTKNVVFVANKNRSIGCFSSTSGRRLHQITADSVTAIPSVVALHPNTSGTVIAGANASGKCLVWS